MLYWLMPCICNSVECGHGYFGRRLRFTIGSVLLHLRLGYSTGSGHVLAIELKKQNHGHSTETMWDPFLLYYIQGCLQRIAEAVLNFVSTPRGILDAARLALMTLIIDVTIPSQKDNV